MIRFSIRDLVWLTLLAAVLMTWWIDRSNLSASHAKSLKDEAALRAFLMEAAGVRPSTTPSEETIDTRRGPDGLRKVPGDADYQFPPEYPLHYDYRKLPDLDRE